MSTNVSHLSKRMGIKAGLYHRQIDVKADERTELAREALVGTAVVEGSRTFYDFMIGEESNKRAYVCNGTACLCHGQQDTVRETLENVLGPDEVGTMTCLGHCHTGGGFLLDEQTYNISHLSQITNLVNQKPDPSLITVGRSLNEPVLLKPCGDLASWYQPALDAVKNNDLDALLEQMLAASVRGRGGAGFPAGIKWQACKDQPGDEKYIVCNADEGDPGAFSDRYLLEHHPHSVIFGMLLAGLICGAKEGVLYLRVEYPEAIKVCEDAIAELKDMGVLFAPLNEDGARFDLHLMIGSGAYICGEETALLRSIEGQRPVVSVRPPFPVESGLFGAPTVVNNVETFACAHWIIANGGAEFAALGTDQSAGVKLLSLDHTFNNPGLVEVPMGISLTTVINELGGGFRIPVKALHIGGPLGGVVPKEKFADLTISFESFADNGFLLGHGSLLGIPETTSLVEYIRHLFEFTAHESCGKCFPCRLGATRGKEMFARAEEGSSIDEELLNDLLETMELGSLCALGGGVPLPIKNILTYFHNEIFPAAGGSA